jgi:hypothetical protein
VVFAGWLKLKGGKNNGVATRTQDLGALGKLGKQKLLGIC